MKHAHPCPECGAVVACIEIECTKRDTKDVALLCDDCAKKKAASHGWLTRRKWQ